MQKAARGGLLRNVGAQERPTTKLYASSARNSRTQAGCSGISSGALPATTQQGNRMDYRVSYEHSLASDPDAFIVHVPGQVITDVPATVPRALLKGAARA